MRVVQTCSLNTVGMDMGQAFQSKMENRYPWDAPAGQAGKRRDSSEHMGAGQLLRARHIG